MSRTKPIDAALKEYVFAFRTVRSSDLTARSAWIEKWYYEKEYQVYQSPYDFIPVTGGN
jgi:hypothetical protein